MGEYPHGQGSNIRPAGCSPFTAERLSFVWSFIQPPRCGGANPSEPPNPLTLRKQACIDNGDDAFRRGPPALGRIVLAVWIMAF